MESYIYITDKKIISVVYFLKITKKKLKFRSCILVASSGLFFFKTIKLQFKMIKLFLLVYKTSYGIFEDRNYYI